MSTEWLSIVEYAKIHDVSDMTVRRRIKSGKIQAVLKDGKYFIQAEENNFGANEPQKESSLTLKSLDTAKHFEKSHLQSLDEKKVLEPIKNIPLDYDLERFSSTPRIEELTKDTSIAQFADTLDKLTSQIGLLESKNQNYLESLKRELDLKQEKIDFLLQKIEDLELLIKVFEKTTLQTNH